MRAWFLCFTAKKLFYLTSQRLHTVRKFLQHFSVRHKPVQECAYWSENKPVNVMRTLLCDKNSKQLLSELLLQSSETIQPTLPAEQLQEEYINFMSVIKKWKSKKWGLCRLLFLSWENDFAYSADVLRAIWLCDLQSGERWHDAAGEISECRAGWLDGILKHLGAENKDTTAVRGRQTRKLICGDKVNP